MNGKHSIVSLFKTEIDEICASLIVQNEEIIFSRTSSLFYEAYMSSVGTGKEQNTGNKTFITLYSFLLCKGIVVLVLAILL